VNKWILLNILGLAIVVGLTLLPTAITPAQEPTPTPPLPTWTPGPPLTKTPVPTSTPLPPSVPAGGLIELRVPLTPPALRDIISWQSLWTVVQWQDAWGEWHDVEGWQGTLDTVAVGENGEIVGQKLWWVATADLGKGPFRWLVYESERGKRLSASETFYLPDSKGETAPVEVSLDH